MVILTRARSRVSIIQQPQMGMFLECQQANLAKFECDHKVITFAPAASNSCQCKAFKLLLTGAAQWSVIAHPLMRPPLYLSLHSNSRSRKERRGLISFRGGGGGGGNLWAGSGPSSSGPCPCPYLPPRTVPAHINLNPVKWMQLYMEAGLTIQDAGTRCYSVF